MRPCVFGLIERERSSLPVIAAKAARAMPDRDHAVDVTADRDADAGTAGPPRLLGDLQGNGVQGDDVVLADAAVFLFTENCVEIHARQRHERGGAVGRRPRELVVVVGQEPFGEVGVGCGERGDAGERQLVDGTALDRAVESTSWRSPASPRSPQPTPTSPNGSWPTTTTSSRSRRPTAPPRSCRCLAWISTQFSVNRKTAASARTTSSPWTPLPCRSPSNRGGPAVPASASRSAVTSTA